MPEAFDVLLTRFEQVIDAELLSYHDILAVFRELELPPEPSAPSLTRLFACCYRLLDFEDTGFSTRMKSELGEHAGNHLEACAGDQIERVLYDANASNRAWIAERIQWHKDNEREIPEDYLDADLPPALEIPWNKEIAHKQIMPLLRYWEGILPEHPTKHFSHAWKVLHNGYPVFKEVFADWMAELDQRGVGLPGTYAAFAKADELASLSDQYPPPSWADCERDLVPLLHDPHPMVVAGAAKALGSYYAEENFPDDPAAPDLAAILNRLAQLETFSAIACGAFVCGFDVDCSGLYFLHDHDKLAGTNFSIDEWVLSAVAKDHYEPYLPNAQAFWFYIHEYYDYKPDMVMQLIDLNRSWLAMMCATEVHERVDGMNPVLERLSTDPDPMIAAAAQQHLSEHYG